MPGLPAGGSGRAERGQGAAGSWEGGGGAAAAGVSFGTRVRVRGRERGVAAVGVSGLELGILSESLPVKISFPFALLLLC